MPLLRRRSRQEDSDNAQERGSAPPAGGQADDVPAIARGEGAGLEPRLERKWEEAFRQARSR